MPATIYTTANVVISTNIPGIKMQTIGDIRPDPGAIDPPEIPEGTAMIIMKVDGYEIEDAMVNDIDGSLQIDLMKVSE